MQLPGFRKGAHRMELLHGFQGDIREISNHCRLNRVRVDGRGVVADYRRRWVALPQRPDVTVRVNPIAAQVSGRLDPRRIPAFVEDMSPQGADRVDDEDDVGGGEGS